MNMIRLNVVLFAAERQLVVFVVCHLPSRPVMKSRVDFIATDDDDGGTNDAGGDLHPMLHETLIRFVSSDAENIAQEVADASLPPLGRRSDQAMISTKSIQEVRRRRQQQQWPRGFPPFRAVYYRRSSIECAGQVGNFRRKRSIRYRIFERNIQTSEDCRSCRCCYTSN